MVNSLFRFCNWSYSEQRGRNSFWRHSGASLCTIFNIIIAFCFFRRMESLPQFNSSKWLQAVLKDDLVITLAARFWSFSSLSLNWPLSSLTRNRNNQNEAGSQALLIWTETRTEIKNRALFRAPMCLKSVFLIYLVNRGYVMGQPLFCGIVCT